MTEAHKGIQARRPVSQNKLQAGMDSTSAKAGEPGDEQLRLDHGVVVAVDAENGKVRVDIRGRNNKKYRLGATERNSDGAWVPIQNSYMDIHQRFGSLRVGLIVSILWRGKLEAGSEAVVSVVSEEEFEVFATGKKSPRSNELATLPHDIFCGGSNFGV